MSFIWTSMLWSLILIPFLAILYVQMQRRRRGIAARYGSLGLVQRSSGGVVGKRRHLPAILFLLGLTVLFISLARPQMVVGLPKVEGIVILAFDISGSMAAEDFKPNRLEAAKAVAIEFVERQPSTVSIGVVAFSESGLSVLIPSSDEATVVEAIERLIPQRGTSLANGIIASLNTIANITGQEPIIGFEGAEIPTPLNASPEMIVDQSAAIILLTDGENNMNPSPLEAALLAADRGVRIHTIAVGSPEGIELTVNGFTVFTRVDEATLKQISEITQGTFFNAQNEEQLREVYESIEPRLNVEQDETEVTAVFAGVSIFVFLIGGLLSLLWFSRVP
jgi:Ca-activated chloride channel family protein